MGGDHHKWRSGEPPPLIRPHSIAKHRVLGAYLERYVSVLTSYPAQTQFRLTLIDGFAGGGKYLDARTKEDRPGSPLIMLNAMRAAGDTAKAKRASNDFNLDVEYFFIEKSAEALQYLRDVIEESEFRLLLADKIRLIKGDFVDQIPSILEFVKGRGRAGRALFVLDQFGYSDVPIPSIATILSRLPNAEVILTFATDWLIDYLNSDEPSQQRLAQLGLHLPAAFIRDAKTQRDWRRTIQFALHDEIWRRTGARFYTPFFIRSVDSHRDFWLIHLSGHHRARDVMVGLHWEESTSFAHYGRSGLRMLGYDQRVDEYLTKQKILPAFCFDGTALASSQEALFEELPQRVSAFSNGIVFDDLFANLTNESPVTAAIMRDVLNDLARQGVIQVRDKTGSLRKSGIIRPTDVVIPSRQKRFFPP